MDEGIFNGFIHGQFDDIFKAIALGVDVNFRRPFADGVTALMAAAAQGNIEVIKALRTHGAKANVYNFHGQNALDIVQTVYRMNNPCNVQIIQTLVEMLTSYIAEDQEREITDDDFVHDYYVYSCEELPNDPEQIFNNLIPYTFDDCEKVYGELESDSESEGAERSSFEEDGFESDQESRMIPNNNNSFNQVNYFNRSSIINGMEEAEV